MKLLLLALLWTIPAFAAQGPTTILCEKDDGNTEKARIVAKMPTKFTLFVCGKWAKKKGTGEISSFSVLVITPGGKRLPGYAFADSSQKRYRVKQESAALVFQELISDGKGQIPAYEIRVACDEFRCRRGEATCSFEPRKDVSKAPLAQLKAYVGGAKKGKVPAVAILQGLARLAYAGDADALKFFTDRGALSLDGEASDVYFDHQAMIEKLRKSGCLKPQAI